MPASAFDAFKNDHQTSCKTALWEWALTVKSRIFLSAAFVAAALIILVLLYTMLPWGAIFSAGKKDHSPPPIHSQASPHEPATTSGALPAPSAPLAITAEDEPFIIKRVLPIKGAIPYGEWHWDESNVPDGSIVVTVDLDARVVSVFRGGYEIGAAAVLLGTEEKPTPLGIFPITQKKKYHESNIYDGAPMPFMQRLTNDGITLHGSEVERGYASHGCVGMPNPFAEKLFNTTKVGDKVYITRGKMIGVGDKLVHH